MLGFLLALSPSKIVANLKALIHDTDFDLGYIPDKDGRPVAQYIQPPNAGPMNQSWKILLDYCFCHLYYFGRFPLRIALNMSEIIFWILFPYLRDFHFEISDFQLFAPTGPGYVELAELE